MENYPPSLPKQGTKSCLYEAALITCDPVTLEYMKEGSSKRRAIEESINNSSTITEAIAREMSGGLTSRADQDIQKLEAYLPIVENLVRHIESARNQSKMSSCIASLKIKWSSSLSTSSLFNCKSPKFYQINNLRFELGMVLSVYGTTLREKARELISTDLVQSAKLFREASGVYHYQANEVLPPLQSFSPSERPPEAALCVSSIMSLICLAEAQAVTARKAEENGNSHALLAKLHYGIRDFLDEAIGILNSSTERINITSRFMDYISSCLKLHELKSFQNFAESLKNDDKIGLAVSFLRNIMHNAQKNLTKEESLRSITKQVIQEMNILLHKYEHENEVVWLQTIPTLYELPLPGSVKIATMIPYCPKRCETPLLFKS